MRNTRPRSAALVVAVAAVAAVALLAVSLGADRGPQVHSVRRPAPRAQTEAYSSSDLPALAGAFAAEVGGGDTAFVFATTSWSDGLAAAAGAVHRGASLVVLDRDGIPTATALSLGRQGVRHLVVIGGEQAISSATTTQLASLLGADLTHVGGADRFATAAMVATTTFARPSTVVLVDGSRAVDIAAATPVAAALGAPVLLADRGSLPRPTAEALQVLRPARVVVIGGVEAVSESAELYVGGLGATVTRVAGTDRIETAAAAAYFVPPSGTVALTTGSSPTATVLLAAAAARTSAPVLLVQAGCVPTATVRALAERGAGRLLTVDAPAGMPTCGPAVTTTTTVPPTTTTRPPTTTPPTTRPGPCATNLPPKPAVDAGYVYLELRNGRPVRWDPCRSIKVYANLDQAQPGSLEVIRSVLDELSAASGLHLVFAGTTHRALDGGGDWKCQDPSVEPQILVGFFPPGALGHDIAGLGGSCFTTWYYDGEVAVTNDIAPTYDEIGLGHLLLHEFGHALGLDHFQDPADVMCSGCWQAVHLGPGDLAGLWHLGAAAGPQP